MQVSRSSVMERIRRHHLCVYILQDRAYVQQSRRLVVFRYNQITAVLKRITVLMANRYL